MWALSLGPEDRDTLMTLGGEMSLGKKAFTNARKQLIDEGYVLTRSWQDSRGRWVSAVIVSDVPLLEPEAVDAAWAHWRVGSAARRTSVPAQGDPDVVAAVEDEPRSDEPVDEEPPSEDPPDERGNGGGGGHGGGGFWAFLQRRPRSGEQEPGAGGPRSGGAYLREGTTKGGFTSLPRQEQEFENDDVTQLLRRIVAKDRRLWLTPKDAAALVPLVREWLDRGASEQELTSALLDGLPSPIHCPPRLLANRLTRKLPPPPQLPAARPPRPERHECAECCDPIPQAGLCRRCAGVPERVESRVPDRAEIARRGAARVRAALALDGGRAAALPG